MFTQQNSTLQSRKNLKNSILLALVITLFQVLIVTSQVGKNSFQENYPNLCQWDCGWFKSITNNGYVYNLSEGKPKEEQSNLVFFPGYPVPILWLSQIIHLQKDILLLIWAQIAAWGFWAYLILFLVRNEFSWTASTIILTLILTHPASFYLVVGYSESLFMFCLIGFLYWLLIHPNKRTQLALFGAYLASTRFIGLAIIGLPVLAEFLKEKKLRSFKKVFAVALISSSGFLSYFLYLQHRFHNWKLYFDLQKIGWHKSMDFGFFFRPTNYTFAFEPNTLSFHFTLLFFIVIAAVETKSISTEQKRSARYLIYLAAFLLFYISAGFSASKEYESMLRYSLPIHVLLILGLGLRFKNFTLQDRRLSKAGLVLFLSLVFYSLHLQLELADKFTHGVWIEHNNRS